MKNTKKFIFIGAAFALVTLMSSTNKPEHTQCQASSQVGGSCMASCGSGYICACTTTFFSCSCNCYPIRGEK